MLYWMRMSICASLCLLSFPLFAKTGVTSSLIFASAESSSRDSGGDEKQETSGDDVQPTSSDKPSEGAARREPETLTPQGAIGLLLLIGAIGGLSWWIMRPMLRAPEQEDAEQTDSSIG